MPLAALGNVEGKVELGEPEKMFIGFLLQAVARKNLEPLEEELAAYLL